MKFSIAMVKIIDVPVAEGTEEKFCAHMLSMLDTDEKDWYDIEEEESLHEVKCLWR